MDLALGRYKYEEKEVEEIREIRVYFKDKPTNKKDFCSTIFR